MKCTFAKMLTSIYLTRNIFSNFLLCYNNFGKYNFLDELCVDASMTLVIPSRPPNCFKP